MIGGNREFSFHRPVKTRNKILEEKSCYPLAVPIYRNVMCRMMRREPYNRPAVELGKAARAMVEEMVLEVPNTVSLLAGDLAHETATGFDYEIEGVEDISGMGWTYHCPIVRVKNVTKVAV